MNRSESKSSFVCECDPLCSSACVAEPFYEAHEGKQYCVLHYPGRGKETAFEESFQRKLNNKDFDFGGVWFPGEVDLSNFIFGPVAVFCRATFSAKVSFHKSTFIDKAIFWEAAFEADAIMTEINFRDFANFSKCSFLGYSDFSGTKFYEHVNFSDATFNEVSLSAGFRADADFFSCRFLGYAEFTDAEFTKNVSLIGASFEGVVDFTRTTFDAEVNFTSARFADSVRFVRQDMGRQIFGNEAALFFEAARIDHPELVVFYAATLRPTWFINVDSRKFEFIDVEWIRSNVGDDLRRMKKEYLTGFHNPLLATSYRRLALNAEENHRYNEASTFRYMAMDVMRHEPWRRLAFLRRWFAFWTLSWWYWLASGYGERVLRAFLVLLAIWFVAGLLYTRVGFARWEPRVASESDAIVATKDDIGAPLNFRRALTYSAAVMTFQKPEPKPAAAAAHTVVLLETILGPVQAALLALAIRRKFMR